jgi:hypothetical protein
MLYYVYNMLFSLPILKHNSSLDIARSHLSFEGISSRALVSSQKVLVHSSSTGMSS